MGFRFSLLLIAFLLLLADAIKKDPAKQLEKHFSEEEDAKLFVQQTVQQCVNRYKDDTFAGFAQYEPTYVTMWSHDGSWVTNMFIIWGVFTFLGCVALFFVLKTDPHGMNLNLDPYQNTPIMLAYKCYSFLLILFVGFLIWYIVDLDQCHFGNNLKVNIDKIELTGDTTDQIWLIDSTDEIMLEYQSGICNRKTAKKDFSTSSRVHTYEDVFPVYYSKDVTLKLREDDSGFNGKDDMSDTFTIPAETLASMRTVLNTGVMDSIPIKQEFIVDGGTAFDETFWGEILDSMLCVSALDFVLGPAFGRLKTTTKAIRFTGAKQAFAYVKKGTKIKTSAFSKIVSDSEVFTKYGVKEMFKYHTKETIKQTVLGVVEDELNQLILGEGLESAGMSAEDIEIVLEHREAIHKCTMDEMTNEVLGENTEMRNLYNSMEAINNILDKTSICPSDIVESADAPYTVYLSIEK